MISAAQLAKLRTNAGSDGLLLVNFWATWCAPCVDEFPEIEKMVRMYVAKRPLDIVTVSINHPEEKKFVQNFLEKQLAISRNFQFSGNDCRCRESIWRGLDGRCAVDRAHRHERTGPVQNAGWHAAPGGAQGNSKGIAG
jgi:hypothetical protein